MTFFASPRRDMSSCQAASNQSAREILLKYRIMGFIHGTRSDGAVTRVGISPLTHSPNILACGGHLWCRIKGYSPAVPFMY